MISKLEESRKLIDNIRQKLEVLKNNEMPSQLRDAQEDLITHANDYVDDLVKDLAEATSPEIEDQIHKKLVELNENITSTQLLSSAVIMTYNRAKDDKIDPEVVQKTAIDSVRIAWNLATTFAFDDSKSMKEKMVGFAKACLQGTIGMCKGALQGFEEGKGFFDTVKKMVAGTFEQGMEGYNKSLATSLLDEKEKGKLIISDLRHEHRKVEQELANDPENPIKQARKAIVDEEAKYLDELEERLNNSSGKDLSKIVRSLDVLQLSNAGTSLQSSGLSFLHRLVLGDDKNLKKETVEQLGKDTVNITRNINQILDDSSKSLPSKLWDMTKAYGSAAVDGVTAFIKGFEGGGSLKEKYVHAVESGFSTFMSKFSTALDKINPQKKSDTEIELSTLKSTGTRTALPSIELSQPPNTKKESTKETTVQEQRDLKI